MLLCTLKKLSQSTCVNYIIPHSVCNTVLEFILTHKVTRENVADTVRVTWAAVWWAFVGTFLLLPWPPLLCFFALAISWAVAYCCFPGSQDHLMSVHTLWLASHILNQFIIASVTSLTSGPSLWQEHIVQYHSLKGFHSPSSWQTAYSPSYV